MRVHSLSRNKGVSGVKASCISFCLPYAQASKAFPGNIAADDQRRLVHPDPADALLVPPAFSVREQESDARAARRPFCAQYQMSQWLLVCLNPPRHSVGG